MDPERWRMIQNLYHSASSMNAAQREEFLRHASGGDRELKEEIESLLQWTSSTAGFVSSVQQLVRKECGLAAGEMMGPYCIEAIIGVGGMGEVYKAQDTRLHRAVAVKVLRNRDLANQTSRERFRREALAASALSHPNICTVYDVGLCQDQPYLVMEYLQGQTLRERLRNEPLELPELLDWAIQIIDALDTAHSCGIVHRDIKASNIFVTHRKQIKVLDFGIALMTEDSEVSILEKASAAVRPAPDFTESGHAIGTLAYMSPEQARGEKPDSRSDLFSFGVLLYEMSTGTLPFRGETTASILKSIVSEEALPVRTITPDLPRELEQIIAVSIAKSRGERIQSATALRDRLKSLKSTYEVESFRSAAMPHRGWPQSFWLNHRLLLSALPIFAAGIAAVFYLSSGGRESSPIVSLAVLPFDNTSHDLDKEYFSAGVTESIANRLSQINEVRISKVVRKALTRGTHEIRSDLILDGSVARLQDQVQLSVSLTNTRSGRKLWENSYQRPIRDLLSLESEAVYEVLTAMKIPVTPKERAALSTVRAINSEAYDSYLIGRQSWNRQTTSELRRAAESFRRSIELGPTYAPAYAGLADCYSMLAWFGAVRPLDVLDAARAAATKAQQLDPSLAEGYISLGIISGFFDWNWTKAESNFRKAIDLNPNSADAHHWYAHMLEAVARPRDGLAELNRAHELDALYPLIEEDIVLAYLYLHDYDQALGLTQRLLELQPSFWRVHLLLGRIYVEKSMCSKAMIELREASRLSGSNVIAYAAIGRGYATCRQTSEATQILNSLTALARSSYVSPEPVAELLTVLRRHEEALHWMKVAVSNHDPRFPWLVKREKAFKVFELDNRFELILRQMHLLADQR